MLKRDELKTREPRGGTFSGHQRGVGSPSMRIIHYAGQQPET